MAFRKYKQEPEYDVYNEDQVKAGQPSAKKVTTIAVIGSMPRIGTTTQALHIAQYLFYEGLKVAYVEYNDHGFIDLLSEVYQDVGSSRDKYGNPKYENLTLIKKENLPNVMRPTGTNDEDDYDYLVYDFGSRTDANFTEGFEQFNVQVLIGGSSPKEIVRMTEALADRKLLNAKCIISFCPKDDRNNYLALMKGRNASTFFAAYAPDMFRYAETMNPVYKKILPEVTTDGE